MATVDLAMGDGHRGKPVRRGNAAARPAGDRDRDRRRARRQPAHGPGRRTVRRHGRGLGALAGVVPFGLGIYVHKNAPRGSLPWLMVVLFSAWIGQLASKQMIDATLSGFIGAAVMVPVAHAVAHVRPLPPAHVMFLPAFWLLVPGTIGLIGVTELVGDNTELGSANLGAALAAIPSVASGSSSGRWWCARRGPPSGARRDRRTRREAFPRKRRETPQKAKNPLRGQAVADS